MLSLSSHLALNNLPMFHSFVDSFFEGKKALVKERLMESVKVIVDGLFEEMVGQVKEMMLVPPKSGHDQVKPSPMSPPTSSKLNTNMIFANKSKPYPSTSTANQPPFSGLYKRMAEEDGQQNNIGPNKKQSVTVELEIDDPFGGDDDDEVANNDACGDVIELANNSAHNNILAIDIPSTSKKQEQPTGKTVSNRKMVSCPELGCGKLILCKNLKRHRLTHFNVKPYGCTFNGCTQEFNQREHAISHIRNVHLKKSAKDGIDDEGEGDETPDPSTYVSIKKDLL